MEVATAARHSVWVLTVMGLVLGAVASGFETVPCNSIICGHGARCNGSKCVCRNGFVKSIISDSATPATIYCHGSCSDTKNCSANSTCEGIIIAQNTYSCICSAGYTRSSTGYCVGVNDQCALGLCGANSVCSNIPGSFNCTCNEGYTRLSSQKQTADCIVTTSTSVVTTKSTTSTTSVVTASASREKTRTSTITRTPAHRFTQSTAGDIAKQGTTQKTSPSFPLVRTSTSSEKRMGQNDDASQMLVIALAAGISGGVVLIAIVVISLVMRRRQRNKHGVDKNRTSVAEETSGDRISFSNTEANSGSIQTIPNAAPLVVIRTEVFVFDGRPSVGDGTHGDKREEPKSTKPVEYSLPHKNTQKSHQIPDEDSLHSNSKISHTKDVQKEQNGMKRSTAQHPTDHYDTLYSFDIKPANQNAGNIQVGLDGSGSPVRPSAHGDIDIPRTDKDSNSSTKNDEDILYDRLKLPKV